MVMKEKKANDRILWPLGVHNLLYPDELAHERCHVFLCRLTHYMISTSKPRTPTSSRRGDEFLGTYECNDVQ
jgi:hypothetical protein